MREWERRLGEIAAMHDGLVGWHHVSESFDQGSAVWSRARRTGRWVPLSKRVLRSLASPETEAQRVRAALLDAGPGAFLYGRPALAWLGMRGFNLAVLDVARVRGVSGMPCELAKLHQARAVRAHHVLVVRDIVTQNAVRAIWTEAARYSQPHRYDIGYKKIGVMLDQAHREHLVTWAALHDVVDDISQRGRAGTRLMRHLASERLPGSSPTDSRLEDRFEEVLSEFGVQPLRRQIHLGGHEPIGRVDYSDDEVPLSTEVNSLLFHTAPTDRAADERRYVALMDAGFTVLVIWEDDLWKNPRAVVELVHRARRYARVGRRVVLHSPSCPWPFPRVGDIAEG